MKPLCHSRASLLATAGTMLFAVSSSVHAVDYSYGSGSGTTPFSITATEQARQTGFSWNGNIDGADFGAVYFRDVRSDRTFMRFDLSSLAGAAISGNVTLSLTVDAQYGGDINNGQISTANAAWSIGGGAPGITAISGSAGPSASFATDDIATWTLPGSALQGYVGSPSFHGLVVSADSGSTAHFKSLATLTGTTIGGEVVVLDATDWSAATFDGGSSTLNVTGTSDVSGGNVTIQPGATLAISGDATMSSGAFTGAINNNGIFSMGSSVNHTLSGVLSGTGTLSKSGSATLTLAAANTYSGATTVSGGSLVLASGASVYNSDIGLSNNANLTFEASNSRSFSKAITGTAGDVTFRVAGNTSFWGGADGTNFALGNSGLFTGNIVIETGLVSPSSDSAFGDPANLVKLSPASGQSAGLVATSTLTLPATRSIELSNSGAFGVLRAYAGQTFTIEGPISGAGNLFKTDGGTVVLSGINSYTGSTSIGQGALVLSDDAQLKFVVSDTNQNSVTGSGTATFNGDFNIDTSAVTGATGHIWLLVDKANLNPASSFESTFNVLGFTQQLDGVTWTMTDAKGDWSFSEETGELTLDIGSDYDAWGSAYGLATGSEGDDLDNDGLTNGEEHAFGLIPNSGSSVNPITSPLDKTTGQFSYQRRDNGLTELDYTIWYSTDLSLWTEDTGASQPEGTPDGNGVETIQVTLSPALLTNSKLFVQVRAQ